MAYYKATLIFGLLVCVSLCTGLDVDIRVTYNPPANFILPSPPFFHPATSVILTCQVEGASGDISYLWSSTNSKSFVVNRNSSNVSQQILTSDDAGNHTCYVTDSSGNSNFSNIEMQLIECNVKYDIIFVLDSSGSIGRSNFAAIRKFVLDFVQELTIGPNDNQIGVILFSSSASIVFNLNSYSSKGSVLTAISNIGYTGGGTSTHSALQLLIAQGFTTRRGARLSDGGISRLAVVLTDGESSSKAQTLSAASAVHSFTPSINVYAIGVGSNINQIELNAIASQPSYVSLIASFTLLENLQQQLSYELCFKVDFDMDITPPAKVALQPFTLKCNASIVQSNLARGLMQYAHLEWVGPDGEVLTNNGSITITEKKEIVEDENGFRNNLTSTLMFNPVMFHHEGEYTCRSKIDFPNRKTIIYNQISTRIQVVDQTLIQLKFGPLPHCSRWYKDKNITTYLERDVRKVIMDVLNKSCDYTCQKYPNITDVEFSCQSYVSCVTFRATLTGSKHTIRVSQLTTALRDWLNNDGTFVYNYNIPIRLRADPECPIKISDFFDEECIGKECHDISCS